MTAFRVYDDVSPSNERNLFSGVMRVVNDDNSLVFVKNRLLMNIDVSKFARLVAFELIEFKNG